MICNKFSPIRAYFRFKKNAPLQTFLYRDFFGSFLNFYPTKKGINSKFLLKFAIRPVLSRLPRIALAIYEAPGHCSVVSLVHSKPAPKPMSSMEVGL